MGKKNVDRRGFIKRSVGVAAAAGLSGSRVAATAQGAGQPSGSHPIRLGGPIYVRTDDPGELARAYRKLGYRAAYCPNVSVNDTDRIRAFSDAFAKQDVVVAEVGRWCNLLEADSKKRRANLDRVVDGLALAEAIGAICCVNIAGSYNAKVWYGPHPDNLSERFFDAAVENARKIIDAVKPKRAKFCYEMMGWLIPDSPDSYLKLIEAVDRDAFAVHLDPCNLINSPERFYRNADLLNECFDKLGPWIVSCHAKDLKWEVEMNVHFVEVIPGTGSLDYETFLRRLAALPNDAPLMMEHLRNAEEYDQARKYILGLAPEVGVRFE